MLTIYEFINRYENLLTNKKSILSYANKNKTLSFNMTNRLMPNNFVKKYEKTVLNLINYAKIEYIKKNSDYNNYCVCINYISKSVKIYNPNKIVYSLKSILEMWENWDDLLETNLVYIVSPHVDAYNDLAFEEYMENTYYRNIIIVNLAYKIFKLGENFEHSKKIGAKKSLYAMKKNFGLN